MKRETFDRARAAAMACQVGVDFEASLTVALAYIGDRLGLFQLMATSGPMTSQQIAERTDSTNDISRNGPPLSRRQDISNITYRSQF
jgi:hypothetical protein